MLDEAGRSSTAKWIMILMVLVVVGFVAAYAFKNMGNLPTGDEGSGEGQPMDVPVATMVVTSVGGAAAIVSPAIPPAPKHHAAGGKNGCPV